MRSYSVMPSRTISVGLHEIILPRKANGVNFELLRIGHVEWFLDNLVAQTSRCSLVKPYFKEKHVFFCQAFPAIPTTRCLRDSTHIRFTPSRRCGNFCMACATKIGGRGRSGSRGQWKSHMKMVGDGTRPTKLRSRSFYLFKRKPVSNLVDLQI